MKGRPFEASHRRRPRAAQLLVAALLFRFSAGLSAENNNNSNRPNNNNNNNTPLFQGPGYNFLPPPPMQPRGQELLEKMELESSIEPGLAKAPASQIPNLLTASVPLALRAASGVFGLNYQLQWIPRDDSKYAYVATQSSQLQETCFVSAKFQGQQPIVLYDVESDAQCRQVREACSLLSLTLHVRPTPNNGIVFAKELQQDHGPQARAPFLVDPNSSISLSGTRPILNYLFATYGTGPVPWPLNQAVQQPGGRGNTNNDAGPLTWSTLSSTLAVTVSRWGAGGTYQYSNPPPRTVDGQPALTLWAYEGSPYCKLVREVLSALELEHVLVYAPRGSPNRQRLWQQMGRFQVPFLTDDDTGVALFESAAIIEYLQKQYGVAASPVKFM